MPSGSLTRPNEQHRNRNRKAPSVTKKKEENKILRPFASPYLPIPDALQIPLCQISVLKPTALKNVQAPANQAPPAQGNGVTVDIRGVYIILYEINGEKDKYHWAILVATTQTSRVLFHQVNRDGSASFTYEKVVNKVPTHSVSLLCLLKIGVVKNITDETINAFEQCVLRARVQGQLTCRTWVLGAVAQLTAERVIGMPAGMAIIIYLEMKRTAWPGRLRLALGSLSVGVTTV